MEIKGFRIKPDGFLEPFEFNAIAKDWVKGDQRYWIDIEVDVEEEQCVTLKELLEPLALHPLILAGCMRPQDGLRLSPFEKSLYLSLPVQSHRLALARTFVSLVCFQSVMITIHYGTVISLARLASALCGNIRLLAPTTSALLFKVLDHAVNQTVNHVLKARDMVEELAAEVIVEPDEVEATRILALKRRVGSVAVTGEDQLYAITNLQSVQTSAFSTQGLKEYFEDLAGSLDYVMRSINRLDSRLNDLHDFVSTHLQGKAEGRLRFLTVISAIFLPMTLISGIYGMNFDVMPGTHIQWAFFGSLGLMLLIGVGMYVYFWARGWFD